MTGRQRRLRPLLVALALGLSFASLGATCVDGVTPDCSSAEAGCGPGNVDGSVDASTTLPEASDDAATDGAGDAPDDSAQDAPDDVEDAGDGG